MEKQPVLSICYPTYNRGEIIEKTVKHILEYQGDDIEVVVCDNCSPDDTRERITAIKDERLSYYRNDSNILTANLIRVIRYAKARFAMLISDEDEVVLKNLPALIEAVKAHQNVGMIVTSGDIFGKPYFRFRDQALQGYWAIKRIVGHGYLSGLVYNKACIEEAFPDLTDVQITERFATGNGGYAFLCVAFIVAGTHGLVTTSSILFDHCYEGTHDNKTYFTEGRSTYSPEDRIVNAKKLQGAIKCVPLSRSDISTLNRRIRISFASAATVGYIRCMISALNGETDYQLATPDKDFRCKPIWKQVRAELDQNSKDIGIQREGIISFFEHPITSAYDIRSGLICYLSFPKAERELRERIAEEERKHGEN